MYHMLNNMLYYILNNLYHMLNNILYYMLFTM